MGLKKREITILEYILAKESITNILKYLKISERNLRYSIENLNYYLEKILNKRIIKKVEYKIELSEKEKNLFLKEVYKKYYLFVQEERAEYLLLSFLFNEKIRLKDLEKKLNITRATLKKDIEYLNNEIDKYGLKIENIKNRFQLNGNEKKYRHLKTIKFLHYKKDKGVYNELDFIFFSIKKEEIDEIEKIVKNIEKELKGKFPKQFKSFMYHFIYFSKERVEKNMIINKKANYKFLEKIEEFEVIKSNFSKIIKSEWRFELAHMTEYFLSYGLKSSFAELKFCVEQFLANLFLELNKKLSSSVNWKELKEKFLYYLVSAQYRLKNNFIIDGYMEKDRFFYIIRNYAEKDRFLPEKLTENEIYYLSKSIRKFYELEQNKVIDIEELLDLITNHSIDLDRERLKKELIKRYNRYIKN